MCIILNIHKKVVKIWVFFSSQSVFIILRTVFLSFWVIGSQLSQCFAVRNSVFFLSKTRTKVLWLEKFKFSNLNFVKLRGKKIKIRLHLSFDPTKKCLWQSFLLYCKFNDHLFLFLKILRPYSNFHVYLHNCNLQCFIKWYLHHRIKKWAGFSGCKTWLMSIGAANLRVHNGL